MAEKPRSIWVFLSHHEMPRSKACATSCTSRIDQHFPSGTRKTECGPDLETKPATRGRPMVFGSSAVDTYAFLSLTWVSKRARRWTRAGYRRTPIWSGPRLGVRICSRHARQSIQYRYRTVESKRLKST